MKTAEEWLDAVENAATGPSCVGVLTVIRRIQAEAEDRLRAAQSKGAV